MGCDKQQSYAMVITICSLSDHVPLFLFFAWPQCAVNVICVVPLIEKTLTIANAHSFKQNGHDSFIETWDPLKHQVHFLVKHIPTSGHYNIFH
jgi:hypothetical protein